MNSQRQGQGVEKWVNGNMYTGGFVNDKKDGYGTIFSNLQERLYGRTEVVLKVSFTRGIIRGLESTNGKTGRSMRVIGKRER